ncbi:interferon-induced protein 44-like [Panthera leo]|uniref:Interferon-induced protein 44-like n=1 Tax=Panthera leo TaxID=9689 RepID=A0A8C8WUA1_PANLE|nr:interferon-induced protein 44-like [Panthera leo]XP_042808273.1 interferon-induced protein 44-like [Panthera leo]
MAVTTRLTWNEEKSLQKLLGNVSLRLLYKSSVHGHTSFSLLDRCQLQGSTITILYFYNKIIGVFIPGHYPAPGKEFTEPIPSFCFSFQRNKATEMAIAVLEAEVKIASGQLTFCSFDQEMFCIDSSKTKLSIHPLLSSELGVHISSDLTYLENEVFRVEGIKDDTTYMLKVTRASKQRNWLLAELRAFKPKVDLISEICILLLGPVGSGKSSFINSVKSVFQGRLTRQAIVGSDDTSITEQYRIYSVKDGKDDKYLPFMLCDSMGLHEEEGVGLCVDDIPHILKGCVPDRYEFSPHKSITPDHPMFIASPSLKDKIHCVAYVLDINSISSITSKELAKFKEVQKEVLSCGTALVVLLTKIDKCSEILQDNFLNMNNSMTSQSQIIEVSKMLDIPIYNIFMVENYSSELELDPLKDTLILFVLRQMLRIVDDILEDLPLETGRKAGRKSNARDKKWT